MGDFEPPSSAQNLLQDKITWTKAVGNQRCSACDGFPFLPLSTAEATNTDGISEVPAHHASSTVAVGCEPPRPLGRAVSGGDAVYSKGSPAGGRPASIAEAHAAHLQSFRSNGSICLTSQSKRHGPTRGPCASLLASTSARSRRPTRARCVNFVIRSNDTSSASRCWQPSIVMPRPRASRSAAAQSSMPLRAVMTTLVAE